MQSSQAGTESLDNLAAWLRHRLLGEAPAEGLYEDASRYTVEGWNPNVEDGDESRTERRGRQRKAAAAEAADEAPEADEATK